MVMNHYRWDFIGLSTDPKPTADISEKVTDGSTFYCSDTSKLYVYCQGEWYEKTSTGGGGGTSYTAGNGIDITSNTISVDTDTIQEKLTAGTNITIEDNTISATGGGSITPVQSAGTSTTDVMSQNAVTSLIFADPSTRYTVKIGTSNNVGSDSVSIGSFSGTSKSQSIALQGWSNGNHGVAIGKDSEVANGANNSIAIGYNSKATRAGEFNVGSGNTTYGYNSTKYRVIGGVHDGVDANDAVTVSQVNSVIDAINTALSTNISHIGS
jgi:hypothetical protein